MKIYKTLFSKLSNNLYERKIINGSSDYVKFIIVGRGRSGTNLLHDSLNERADVRAYGEVFNPGKNNPLLRYGSVSKLPKSSSRINHQYNNPIDFIEKYIYREYQSDVRAVGFKIFYQHCQNQSQKKVWDYLSQLKNIHVVHMRRENKLKTFVSLKLAFLTNQWKKNLQQHQ